MARARNRLNGRTVFALGLPWPPFSCRPARLWIFMTSLRSHEEESWIGYLRPSLPM